MRRTGLLQENRKMRFEEIYKDWNARHLTQEKAAQLTVRLPAPRLVTRMAARPGSLHFQIIRPMTRM
jgi:hypothetical protein